MNAYVFNNCSHILVSRKALDSGQFLFSCHPFYDQTANIMNVTMLGPDSPIMEVELLTVLYAAVIAQNTTNRYRLHK